MLKGIRVKFILVLCAVIWATIYVLPTINNKLWPYKKINLGLDLQGGMHLVLEVDVDKAVSDTIDRTVYDLKRSLKDEKIRYLDIKSENDKITVKMPSDENRGKLEKLLKSDFSDFSIDKSFFEAKDFFCVIEMPSKEKTRIKQMAVEQALETIRNRIDAFGVSEPDIRIQGKKRILVQLPGISDTQKAKELIGKTALLEFKLVNETANIQDAYKGKIPLDSELLYPSSDNQEGEQALVVKKRALLTGASVKDAMVRIDSRYNEPYVLINFDRRGGRIFAKITGENVKKRLAIVLDNKIYSAPVIQERIDGASARISGRFSTEDAHILSIVLRAGALPAPVKIIEERTVGPTLGLDSIKKGVFSTLMGALLVIVFMVIYYKSSGLIADLALLFNVVFIIAALASLQATLTLPGIAGIILTIGMAVDANVLIFERIKEELRLGSPFSVAVDAGFSRASLTILDANITTLIAAIVLFQFGTGPVKGFAVTLTLGVLASLFTALILSKLIFDYLILNLKVKKLSI